MLKKITKKNDILKDIKELCKFNYAKEAAENLVKIKELIENEIDA